MNRLEELEIAEKIRKEFRKEDADEREFREWGDYIYSRFIDWTYNEKVKISFEVWDKVIHTGTGEKYIITWWTDKDFGYHVWPIYDYSSPCTRIKKEYLKKI